MIIVDTSVWIEVLKDKSGLIVGLLKSLTRIEEILFCRFIQLELLQGAKNEHEWKKLDEYLETQYYLEAKENTWRSASLIYFNLRKQGVTIRSPIDCCIAQIAIENDVMLVHRDQDFTRISEHYPLMQQYFEIENQL